MKKPFFHGLLVAILILLVFAFLGISIQLISGLRPRALPRSRTVTRASISVRMAGARTWRNLAYCNTTSHRQQLDLYVPQKAGPHPLVVFVHGGGWGSGDKVDPIVSTYGPSIVSGGSALASINYRFAPRFKYPAASEDVDCALNFLYSHAGSYGLDQKRVVLFGASAGGQLASYAGLSSADSIQPWRQSIRGVIDFYGISDFKTLPSDARSARSAQRFLGSVSSAQAASASPLTYANQPTVPFLILHGEGDNEVPLSQSQELATALQTHGNQVTFITVRRAGHGFGFNAQPTVKQINALVEGFLDHAFSS
jgi:acetyl esterase/lipase